MFLKMGKVELKIDGLKYEGWQQVTINRSIEALAGRFNLELVDQDPIPVPRSGAIELLLYGETIITGYTDAIKYDVSGDRYTLSVDGRDKTMDLVDCSALVSSQEILNASLQQIIDESIKPFGISAIYNQNPTEKFKKFSFQEESGYEAIERATRLRGVLATADALGNIVVQNYGASRATDALVMGENILYATSSFDDTNRFSEYLVYGQQPGDDNNTGTATTGSKGSARDLGITRYRPKIIIAEGAVDNATAQKRAEWESTIRAARGVGFDIGVQGWQQSDERLWRENTLVRCRIPQHGVDSDLLIKEVSFSLDPESGEKTRLVCVRPDAYELQPDLEKESLDNG